MPIYTEQQIATILAKLLDFNTPIAATKKQQLTIQSKKFIWGGTFDLLDAAIKESRIKANFDINGDGI